MDAWLGWFVVLGLLLALGVNPYGSLSSEGAAWAWVMAILFWGSLMIAASAAFLALNGGRTPGKAVAGLRVGRLTGFRHALRREAFRWVPFLAFYAVLHGTEALQTVPDPLPKVGALIPVAASFALLWYYVMPFFSLDGDYRARWDRIVGTRVEPVRP